MWTCLRDRAGRCRVRVTVPFLLLVAGLNYLDQQGVVGLSLLACAMHELGHFVAIACLGGTVTQFRLTAVGGEITLERGLSYGRELSAAAAGPLTNLLSCALFGFLPGGALFAGIHLVLGAFNLLPLEGLDGGRMVGCALCLTAGPDAAERVLRCLSWVLSGGLLGLGAALLRAGGSPTLLITAVWLTAACVQQEKAGKKTCVCG